MKHWLLLFTCLFSTGTLMSQEDWKLAKSNDDILIYVRDVPGFAVKEYRAEVTVDAPLEEVVSFFGATISHAEWMEGVQEVRRAEGTPDRIYYRLRLPFPFRNRYMWLYESIETGADFYAVRLTEAPGDGPEGSVKLPVVRGFWEFERIHANSTRIRQQFVSDPGGAIPEWLVNLFVVKNPYKTMKNLRSALASE